jgi:uncharacterized protein YxjI
MGFQRRHDESAGTRYQMREKLFSVGDDFWIETESGERAFKVNRKAVRVRSAFILQSPVGEELFKIQERKLPVRDTMKVERDGETGRDDQEGADHAAAWSVCDRARGRR